MALNSMVVPHNNLHKILRSQLESIDYALGCIKGANTRRVRTGAFFPHPESTIKSLSGAAMNPECIITTSYRMFALTRSLNNIGV